MKNDRERERNKEIKIEDDDDDDDEDHEKSYNEDQNIYKTMVRNETMISSVTQHTINWMKINEIHTD